MTGICVFLGVLPWVDTFPDLSLLFALVLVVVAGFVFAKKRDAMICRDAGVYAALCMVAVAAVTSLSRTQFGASSGSTVAAVWMWVGVTGVLGISPALAGLLVGNLSRFGAVSATGLWLPAPLLLAISPLTPINPEAYLAQVLWAASSTSFACGALMVATFSENSRRRALTHGGGAFCAAIIVAFASAVAIL
jgi:hypothetical protein